MFGLTSISASAASLLLNLEGVFTALLAWFLFQEHYDRRIILGMAAITAGAAVLAWTGTWTITTLWGPLAVAGACLAWGLDNNLSRKVALCDPVQIAMIKGLAAGTANLAIASWHYEVFLMSRRPACRPPGLLPRQPGCSSVRCGIPAGLHRAYFSVAPFAGGLAGMILFRRGFPFLAAAVLMAWGVWLHLTERHEHDHAHEEVTHEHAHAHGPHHQHPHDELCPACEPHSHWHVHFPLTHFHLHFPDTHHRHRH
jgi:hypothetical protein